jgi:hypothetical protein
LRALGRIPEALSAMRATLRMREEAEDWTNAAISASNLSETELLAGEIPAAAATAKRSVAFADRTGRAFSMIANCVTQADVALAAGELEDAKGLFADAEQRQKRHSKYPLLSSLQGYRFCDLLLSCARAVEARDRAARTIEIARRDGHPFEIAIDTLTLGRSDLAITLQRAASSPSANTCDDQQSLVANFDEAVAGLSASGEAAELIRGLLARAAFRRAVGDWEGAKSDLNEAKEIAEPGLMRLYWCDCALEGARLALARCEAFAPLNGLVEASPPRPVPPDASAAAALREEARSQLEVARKLIAECGYHRRDEELAELDTVVAGDRRFADLPPRV